MYIQLIMFLFDVCKSLDKAKIGYAIVGGYALALHGIVRATMDVDLVIQIKRPKDLLDIESIEKKLSEKNR